MKKFIAISILSAMSLGLINPMTIENTPINLKIGENQYSIPKESNNKENFVKFSVSKIDSMDLQNENTTQNEKNNNEEKSSNESENNELNFNEGLNAKDIYPQNPNSINYNNINTMPYPYNGMQNGYGYNGFNGMNYGYGYPMNNMQNNPFNNYDNNLNTYNMPTYTPSRSNLNSYKNELEVPSHSNLDTYKKSTNAKNNKNNQNSKSNDEIYKHLKENENNYIKSSKNNRFNYENDFNYNGSQVPNYHINNKYLPNDTLYPMNQDNYMEKNLQRLIIEIKNLCINQDEYNSFSENYISSRNQIATKIDEANKIIDSLQKNNLYIKDSQQKNKIMEKANIIYEKLQNIELNTNNKFGFDTYGLRLTDDSTTHFELYDTMSSNYPLYQEINTELDNLISLLNEIYNQNTVENNAQSNIMNSTNISTTNNTLQNTKKQDKVLKQSNTSNNQKTIDDQQNTSNPQEENSNKHYAVQKPEAPTLSKQIDSSNKTNTKERLENRKETLNKYLPKSNNEQANKQSLNYHNPYEPNNNPKINS